MQILVAVAMLATPAHAEDTGTLQILKQGLFPTHVWVDGQAQGKVKKKKPLVMTLPVGAHEVWYAADADGVVTLCHGLVHIAKGAATSSLYRDRGCEGLQPGWPRGRSAFKGSEVNFRVDDAVDAWVSIDGGQAMALPDMPFLLNLAPGTHTMVLYTDVMQESVFDQGTVSLRGGERLNVTCTTAGCVGFDQPPVFIVELRESPDIQLAIPGVTIDLSITADEAGVGTSLAAPGVHLEVEAGESGARIDLEVDE